jgi:tRNA splicing endonuclease
MLPSPDDVKASRLAEKQAEFEIAMHVAEERIATSGRGWNRLEIDMGGHPSEATQKVANALRELGWVVDDKWRYGTIYISFPDAPVDRQMESQGR